MGFPQALNHHVEGLLSSERAPIGLLFLFGRRPVVGIENNDHHAIHTVLRIMKH